MLDVINRCIFLCGLLSSYSYFQIYFCENVIINDVIYIYISLKTSNILEIKSQVFERND